MFFDEKEKILNELKVAIESLDNITEERNFLKSNISNELQSAQEQLKIITEERNNLSSLLQVTAKSSLSLSKLLTQMSSGVIGNTFVNLAELDTLASELSNTRNSLKTLPVPASASEDLKKLLTDCLPLALDISSPLTAFKAWQSDSRTSAVMQGDHDSKMSELQSDVDDVKAQLAAAVAVIDAVKALVADDGHAAADIDTDKVGQKVKDRLDGLKFMIEGLKEELVDAEANAYKLSEEVAVLKKTATDKEQKHAADIEAKGSEKKQFSQNLDDKDQQIKEMKSKLESAENTPSDQKNQSDLISEKDKQIEEINDKLNALQTENKDLETRKLELEKENKTLSDTISDLKLHMDSPNQVNKDIERLNLEKSTKSEKITELESYLNAPKEELTKTLEPPAEDLTAELERLRQEILTLQSDLKSKSDIEQKLNSEIDRLTHSLKDIKDSKTTATAVDTIDKGNTDQTLQDDDAVKPEDASQPQDEQIDDSKTVELTKQIAEVKVKISELQSSLKDASGKQKKKMGKQITTEKASLEELEDKLASLPSKVEGGQPPTIEVIRCEADHTMTPAPSMAVDSNIAGLQESAEIDMLHAVDDKATRLKLYLEKVFDHIALMDIDLREKNEQIAEMTADIAKTERFKDCHMAIVHILGLAVKGVKAVSETAEVDASEEIKELEKNIEQVKHSVRNIDVSSKQCSTREIIIQNEHVEVTVNSPKDDTSAHGQIKPVSDKAIQEELKTTNALSQIQRSNSEKVHDIFQRLVKAKMTNEKLTDNIAQLTFILSETVDQLNAAQKETLGNEATVDALKSSFIALQKLLNSGDENMQRIAQQITVSLGDSIMGSPIKHADTPSADDFRNDSSAQGVVSHKDQQADPEQDLAKIQAEVEKNGEKNAKLAAHQVDLSTRITELQHELKSQQDAIEHYLQSNSQKDDEIAQYANALAKVKAIVGHLPGMQNLLPFAVDHELNKIEPKESSIKSLDSGRSRDTDKRKQLVDAEKPCLKVTQSESTPDQPSALDVKSHFKEELDKLEELGSHQNQEVERVKVLEETLLKIRLDGEKITQNIATNKTLADEKTREIKVVTEELEKTKENLEHRKKLVELLDALLREARLLQSTKEVTAFAESAIENLKKSDSADLSEDSKPMCNLTSNLAKAGPSTSQAVDQFNFSDVFSCIQNLVHAVQEESTSQGKAILLYADLANQLNVNLHETLTRLFDTMEQSTESFAYDAEAARHSHSIDDMVEAANKILSVEQENQTQLSMLVDQMYERAPTNRKRLGYSSPTTKGLDTSNGMHSSGKK